MTEFDKTRTTKGINTGMTYYICPKCGGPLYPPNEHPEDKKTDEKWCWNCGARCKK